MQGINASRNLNSFLIKEQKNLKANIRHLCLFTHYERGSYLGVRRNSKLFVCVCGCSRQGRFRRCQQRLDGNLAAISMIYSGRGLQLTIRLAFSSSLSRRLNAVLLLSVQYCKRATKLPPLYKNSTLDELFSFLHGAESRVPRSVLLWRAQLIVFVGPK